VSPHNPPEGGSLALSVQSKDEGISGAKVDEEALEIDKSQGILYFMNTTNASERKAKQKGKHWFVL
jgi:hypothetical protein